VKDNRNEDDSLSAHDLVVSAALREWARTSTGTSMRIRVSMMEHKTASFVEERLDELGVEHDGPGATITVRLERWIDAESHG